MLGLGSDASAEADAADMGMAIAPLAPCAVEELGLDIEEVGTDILSAPDSTMLPQKLPCHAAAMLPTVVSDHSAARGQRMSGSAPTSRGYSGSVGDVRPMRDGNSASTIGSEWWKTYTGPRRGSRWEERREEHRREERRDDRYDERCDYKRAAHTLACVGLLGMHVMDDRDGMRPLAGARIGGGSATVKTCFPGMEED